MSYEELLKRARKELPELSEEVGRFEVPKVRGHIQGNRNAFFFCLLEMAMGNINLDVDFRILQIPRRCQLAENIFK